MQLLTMFFRFLREMIFDHKDEYTFSSPGFNTKKVMLVVILIFSLFCNAFLVYNFFKIGSNYIELKAELKTLKASKNNNLPLSDSQKP